MKRASGSRPRACSWRLAATWAGFDRMRGRPAAALSRPLRSRPAAAAAEQREPGQPSSTSGVARPSSASNVDRPTFTHRAPLTTGGPTRPTPDTPCPWRPTGASSTRVTANRPCCTGSSSTTTHPSKGTRPAGRRAGSATTRLSRTAESGVGAWRTPPTTSSVRSSGRTRTCGPRTVRHDASRSTEHRPSR